MPNKSKAPLNSKQFLNLDRQFIPFRDEKDWEIHYTTFGSEEYLGAQTWHKLLTHNRVALLAEAGAGKTAELRAVSNRVNDDGSQAAFYVTLNSVAKHGLRNALETREDQQRFDAWKDDVSEAWFFVDSLDEARLNGETLQTALSQLEKELSPNLHRARTLISCRVSDWRTLSDTADFQKYLGSDTAEKQTITKIYSSADDALLAPIFDKADALKTIELDDEKSNHERDIHVVALAPLSHRQAEKLAAWAGVKNTSVFMQAVHEADATDLANRPQDLLSLAEQWNSNGTIGTKYRALKWSIDQRLRETNLDLYDKDTLTFERAYCGAKVLAAQLTFGKRRLLSWPIEAGVGVTTQDAMDPREALPNFDGKSVTRLLNRAIFDPATFGAVRFHHRSVQELLCSEWLIDQINNGCPIRRVWQLLTKEKYGKVRFRPSMRPVAAWIAQLEPRLFKCRSSDLI